MNKVAVFGNAGGGKSTLSKKLSEIAGLPLYPLDKLKFRPGGAEVPQEEYKRAHQEILASDRWIIDGFGCIETLWERLNAADTLIFVDLPLYVHFWWVTKRAIAGNFKTPEGWPEGSSMLQGIVNSYSVILPCYKRLTPKYREFVERSRETKRVFHIKSKREISQFLASMKREYSLASGGDNEAESNSGYGF